MEKKWVQLPLWLWFAIGLAAIQGALVATEFFWFMALPVLLVLIIWLFTSRRTDFTHDLIVLCQVVARTQHQQGILDAPRNPAGFGSFGMDAHHLV